MKLQYTRRFNNIAATVAYNPKTGNWVITLVGKTFTNHGLFYKLGQKPTWNNQVIGMENDYCMTNAVKAWLYNLAEKRLKEVAE